MWNIYLAGVIIFFTNQIFFLLFSRFCSSSATLLPFRFLLFQLYYSLCFSVKPTCMSSILKNVFLRDVIKTFQDYPMTMSRQTMMTGWTKVQVPPLPLLHLEPLYILPNKVLQKIGKKNHFHEKFREIIFKKNFREIIFKKNFVKN